MKKVIGGRKYDTDTAKFVGKTSSGEVGSFGHYEEELYQKRNGEFFLFGSGSAGSKYSEWTGNENHGIDKIVPLTFEQAESFAEKNLSSDEYESAFGVVSEGADEKEQKTFSISKAASQKLLKLASRDSVSLSDMLTKIIMEFENEN